MFVRIELLDNLGMRMLTIRKKQDKQPRISDLHCQTAAASPSCKSYEETETQGCIVAELRELSPSFCGCRTSKSQYAVKERWTEGS